MRYYLIADDGQKYGPADLASLNQWAAESRLRPDHQLEEETTAQRVQASTVQGIYFPAPGAAPYQGYYQQPGDVAYDDGAADLKNAWIFAVLGLLCCPLVFSILGIVYSNKAKQKGNTGSVGPLVLSIVGLCIHGIFQIIRLTTMNRYR